MAFGLFAVSWGLQIMAGNLAQMATTPDAAQLLHLLGLVFLLPTPYFLVEFAGAQQMGPPTRVWRVLRFAAAGFALTAAALLIVRPALLFGGVTPSPPGFAPVWGPLYTPLVLYPFFGGLALAIGALVLALANASTPRIARRSGVLVAGLGLYAGFAGANNLAFYATWMALDPADFDGLLLLPLFGLLTLVCVLAAFVAFSRAAEAHDQREALHHYLITTALVVPLLWGAIEGMLAAGPVPRLHTVGLWRIAGVAVIAYGLARWRLLDLPSRARRASATTAGVAGALSGGAAAYGAFSVVVSTFLVPLTAAILTFGFSLVPAIKLARRIWVPRSDRAAEQAKIFGQRVDAYRAALEASVARGTLEEDAAFLGALRERFDITYDAHEVLLHLARSAVLLPRQGGADDVYERLRLLGEGGSGRTWLARDRARDDLIVIKEPLERWQRDPEVRERVLREARLAAKVRHPNVVRILDVLEGELPRITMEYVEGGTLDDLLRYRGVLGWREATRVTLDILGGLEAIHNAGIIHRDIKPTNIFLTSDGTAKLGDFGVADTAGSGTTLMSGGSGPSGTPAYMAPEVIEGLTRGDQRSDVYACALVFHECLYGTPDRNERAVLADNEVPDELQRVLAKAMARDPQRRYASARDLASDLKGVVRT